MARQTRYLYGRTIVVDSDTWHRILDMAGDQTPVTAVVREMLDRGIARHRAYPGAPGTDAGPFPHEISILTTYRFRDEVRAIAKRLGLNVNATYRLLLRLGFE